MDRIAVRFDSTGYVLTVWFEAPETMAVHLLTDDSAAGAVPVAFETRPPPAPVSRAGQG